MISKSTGEDADHPLCFVTFRTNGGNITTKAPCETVGDTDPLALSKPVGVKSQSDFAV